MEMKRCTKCGMVFPITSFRKRSNRNGYQTWCKRCEHHYHNHEAPNAFWTRLKSNLKRHNKNFCGTPTELKKALGEPDKCYICGEAIMSKSEAELDHIIPLAKGGETEINNLQWAHKTCNRVKHDMRVDEMLCLFKKIIKYQESTERNERK